ncbi:hypothetical protein DID75_04625 [Candidatus Marinamargulisbacteria bacterium SCGC AG-410-N11]|nr:hypothetical protein DID75_04625 [Candidatus Marinamargulisbacteria bacterium SCGC AG-410-N11]
MKAGLINTQDYKQTILLNQTNDGFTLLQDAVKNGNRSLIKEVKSWYEKAGLINTQEYKQTILLNRTNDGFTLLQSAVINGNASLIKEVKSWYENAKLIGTDEFNQNVILKSAKNKFNILHCFGMLNRITVPEFTKFWKSLRLEPRDQYKLLTEKAMGKFMPGNKRKNSDLFLFFNTSRKQLKKQLKKQSNPNFAGEKKIVNKKHKKNRKTVGILNHQPSRKS